MIARNFLRGKSLACRRSCPRFTIWISHFQVVEVMLPRGVTSDTLARFVGAVRELSALKAE